MHPGCGGGSLTTSHKQMSDLAVTATAATLTSHGVPECSWY
jgi:hypothetical protein